LSRCVEEGSTLSAPLIPWTTAGAFFYGAFKMSPIEYLPFAFTNYLCPLLTIVLVLFGITLIRIPKPGVKDLYYERELHNLGRPKDYVYEEEHHEIANDINKNVC
ncbi:MAG: Na+/H+ antiporter NhaC family protein, partial [Clostridiales bacterium]